MDAKFKIICLSSYCKSGHFNAINELNEAELLVKGAIAYNSTAHAQC